MKQQSVIRVVALLGVIAILFGAILPALQFS